MLKLANKWAKVFLTEPKKCCLSRKPRSISVKVIRIHKMLHPSKQFCSTLSSQPRILLQELKREGIVPRRDFEPRDFVPIRGFDPRDFLPRRIFKLRDFVPRDFVPEGIFSQGILYFLHIVFQRRLVNKKCNQQAQYFIQNNLDRT